LKPQDALIPVTHNAILSEASTLQESIAHASKQPVAIDAPSGLLTDGINLTTILGHVVVPKDKTASFANGHCSFSRGSGPKREDDGGHPKAKTPLILYELTKFRAKLSQNKLG
jgi:hypothetical protein